MPPAFQVNQTTLRYETFSLHWNGSTWSVVPMPKVKGSDNLLAYEFSSMDALSPAKRLGGRRQWRQRHRHRRLA